MFLSRRIRASAFWLALVSMSLGFGSGVVVSQETEAKVDLEELFNEAAADRNAGDYAASAEKLKQYTKLKDDNGAAWHFLGYSLHLDGKLDEAIKAHQKATEFPQYKQLGLYNLGCAYSLKNQPKKSLKYLHEALDSGFNLFEMMDVDSDEWDADLDNVRKAEGFQEIQARAKNNGQRTKKIPAKITDKKFNAKSLVGKWAVTSGTRQGDEIDEERLPPEITIREKDLTIPAGEEEFVMSYKIVDDSKDVIEIDFKIESGPAPEGSAVGIMKLNGKKAKLCYDPTGQNRPTKFETTAENGCFMFVLEKVASKEKAPKEKAAKEKAAKFNVSKVVGKWNVTEGTRDGAKVAEDRLAEAKITFEKDMITIPAGDDEFKMSYTINPDTSPIQIDMKIESGPAPEGSPALGILKFKKGKFVLCYNATGGDRPEKFESTEENGNFLFTMEADKE